MNELEVLGVVSDRLTSAEIPFMLTGSYAMAHYITPRMTRDIDLVVSLREDAVNDIVRAFAADFYIDADDVRSAVATQRMFNVMHLMSGIKIDLIVRKSSEYRQVEFARRKPIEMGSVKTWIVSREDLILSKLAWAKDSNSELQRRDVKALLDDSVDRDYMEKWAGRLGVADLLKEMSI